MTDEGTTVQKQGEIVAVQPTKTGWTEIHLQEQGKQYPYKASTKIEAIIEQAQAALFKEAVLTAKEVDSGNPNPNRPGFNYVNRTAMKVEIGGTVTQTSSAPSRNVGSSSPDETRSSIERQTIVKAVCGMDRKWESDDEFFAFLHKLEAFCAGTAAVPAANPGAVAAGGATYEDGTDIPFAPSVF